MFKYGSNNIGTVYYGSNQIGMAYYGNQLVFQSGSIGPSPGPTKNYFWSEAIEDGTFTLTIASSVTLAMLEYVDYSTDNGRTWVTTNNEASTEITITTPTILAGNKVFWRGKGKAYASNSTAGTYSTFTGSASYNVGGDMGFMFYGEKYSGAFTAFSANYALCSFFRGSTTLVNAEDLILSTESCSSFQQGYRAMFYGCTSLETPPSISLKTATTSEFCAYMFAYCSSLEEIADFRLTTATTSSFEYIYRGCTSLTSIDLSHYGWTGVPKYAFYECTSLTSLTLSSSITALYDYAFAGASASTACGLTSVDLSPYPITRIYSYAFRYCPITNITLPTTLTRIDGYSLQGALITDIQFPTSIATIGGYVFSDCTGLRGKTIDLSNCTNLTNLHMGNCQASGIIIPPSVNKLGGTTAAGAADSFRSTRFAEIDLSGCTNLTHIPLRAFYQSGGYLEMVKLPSSITNVDTSNFTLKARDDSQGYSSKIVCYATTPPTCAGSLNGTTNWDLYVPYSADHSVLAAYQADTYWGVVTHLYELNQDGTIPTQS